MSVRDFLNDHKVAITDVIATITSDTNCTAVDCLGYEGVTFLVDMGNSGDTLSGSLYTYLEVEDSDDNSSFTDCVDAVLSSTVTGANTGTFAKVDAPAEDSRIFAVTYKGAKRYARVVINLTGTHTNGTPIGVAAIRHGKKYKPVG